MWFMTTGERVLAGVALFCLVAGAVVSYAKARAEGLGLTCYVGLAERSERLVVVLVAAGLGGLGVPYILPVGLWLLAAASAFTAHMVGVTAFTSSDEDRSFALTAANTEGAVREAILETTTRTRGSLLDRMTVVEDYERRFADGGRVRRLDDVLQLIGRLLDLLGEVTRGRCRLGSRHAGSGDGDRQDGDRECPGPRAGV